MSRITDKWHRYCLGCGTRHHVNTLKRWSGNQCCPGNRFSRDRGSGAESTHDATLVVKHTRKGALITWAWVDGRPTVSPTEHEEMVEAITTAEDRYDPEALDSGTTVAAVWLDEERIARSEWLEGEEDRR